MKCFNMPVLNKHYVNATMLLLAATATDSQHKLQQEVVYIYC